MGESIIGTLANTQIVNTGGAGRVGQNLIIKLLVPGCADLHIIDKERHSLVLYANLRPGVTFIGADLSERGTRQEALAGAAVVVLLHAQIGGISAVSCCAPDI